MDELDKISPSYDDLVQKEKDITKRYAVVVLVYWYASVKYNLFNLPGAYILTSCFVC